MKNIFFKSKIILLFLGLVIVSLFVKGILNFGIPIGDTSGEVSQLWLLNDILEKNGYLPWWNNRHFIGTPMISVANWGPATINYFFSKLAKIKIEDFESTGRVIKLVSFFSHFFSFLFFYLFIDKVLKDAYAAFFGSLVYSLHPIFITTTAFYGHIGYSLIYPIVPLLLYFVFEALKENNFKAAIMGGLLYGLVFWIQAQYFLGVSFVLGFFLISLIPKFLKEKRNFRFFLFVVFIIAIVFLGSCTFYIGRIITDIKNFFLFPKEDIQGALFFYSVLGRNPLLMFDRDGILTKHLMPQDYFSNDVGAYDPRAGIFLGSLYFGIIPMLLIMVIFLFESEKVRRSFYFIIWIFSLILLTWFSFGPYSIGFFLRRNIENLPSGTSKYDFIFKLPSPKVSMIILCFSLVVVFEIFFFFYNFFSSKKIRKVIKFLDKKPIFYLTVILSSLLTCYQILIFKPFLFLNQKIPFFSFFRVPRFFHSIVFVLSFLSSFCLSIIHSQKKKLAAFFLLTFLVLLDFWPYQKYFGLRISKNYLSNLSSLCNFFKNDQNFYRILNFYDYSPTENLTFLCDDHPHLNNWLPWSQTKSYGYFFRELVSKLNAPDKKEKKVAKNMLSLLSTKYMVIFGDEEERQKWKKELSPYFKYASRIGNYDIYRNDEVKEFIQFYRPNFNFLNDEIPLDLKEITFSNQKNIKKVIATPDSVLINLDVKEPVLLVLSQSWHPFWRAFINEKEVENLKIFKTLMGVYLDKGENQVKFIFSPPFGWFILDLVSLVTIIVSVMFLTLPIKKNFKNK